MSKEFCRFLATAGFSGYLGSQSYKQGAMGFKKGADDELSNAYKAACILSGFAALLVLIAHFKAGAYGYSLRLFALACYASAEGTTAALQYKKNDQIFNMLGGGRDNLLSKAVFSYTIALVALGAFAKKQKCACQ